MLSKRAGVVAAWLAGVAMVTGFGFPGHAAVGPAGQQSPVMRAVDPSFSSIWCSGPRQCLGAGADAGGSASAIWDGTSWRFIKTPNVYDLTALGCSSWTECLAIGTSDTAGVTEEWNGVSWKRLPSIAKAPLESVACAARHRCVALGAGKAFSWNGKAWSRVPLPRQLRAAEFPKVACAGRTSCLALGAAYYTPMAMQWNGTKWRRVAAGCYCDSVSSLGDGRYMAVGYRTLQSPLSSFIWNGQSWRTVPVPVPVTESALHSVSCSGSFCLTVGNVSDFAWNGSKWSMLPATGITSVAVFCARSTACMDVGSGTYAGSGLASFWNGRRWTPMRLSATDRLSGVSCTRPGNCITVGTTNNLGLAANWLAERWNGSAWQVLPGPARSVATRADLISCTQTTFCMTLNSEAGPFDPEAQRWNGRRWIATGLPGQAKGSTGWEGLSCSSGLGCVAVGGTAADAWDGTSWNATTIQGVAGQYADLQDVSCASATMCMAVGYDLTPPCDTSPCTINLLAEEWNGATWSITGSTALGGSTVYSTPDSHISCPSTTFCMEETAGPGETPTTVMSWDGHHWTKQGAYPSHLAANGISCGGTSSCVVIANGPPGNFNGMAEIWNGTSWRTTHLVPVGPVDAVSCPRPERCLAVGTTADDLTMAQFWAGKAWKLLRPVNA